MAICRVVTDRLAIGQPSAVTEFVVGVVCGVFFLGAAWRMRTREFWSTEDARRLAKQKPSRLRQTNYDVDVFITHTLAPILLAGLGAVSIVWGLSQAAG